MVADSSTDRVQLIVKIDGGNGDKPQTKTTNAGNSSTNSNCNNASDSNIWRDSSYSFWNDGSNKRENGSREKEAGEESFDFMRTVKEEEEEDPPSKLISKFIHKQKESGEISIDLDFDMDELQPQPQPHESRDLPPLYESTTPASASRFVAGSPSTNQVSFERPSSKYLDKNSWKQYHDTPEKHKESPRMDNSNDNDIVEVLKCSSNKSYQRADTSFKRKSSFPSTKPKSRLLDPHPTPPPEKSPMKSGKVAKSGLLRSGIFGRGVTGVDENEEDDPWLEEDLPDEYKKEKLSVWVLLEWVSLILIIAALICSLTIHHLKKKKLWDLGIWKWEVLVLVLICGRLVSSWIVRIVVFFIERNFLLRKRVLYFVYGVKKAVQNCLWLGLVLIAWHFMFDKKVERQTNSKALRNVTKVLICLVVGVMVWLVKTVLVKVLASSFHVSTYFDRIQDSLFNQYVIETLSGPPLIELQKIEDENVKIANEVKNIQDAGVTIPSALKAVAFSSSPQSGRVIGSGRLMKSPKLSRVSSSKNGDDPGITIDHLHKLNPKNVSAWNMKRLMNIIRHGALSTLDEKVHDCSHDDESATQIRSEYEAKVAARKIFQNVAKPGSKFIYLEDIMRFMRDDEASKTLSLFEGTSDCGRISKSSLKEWVVNAFRERRALALTLNDTKTAVNKLHRMVNSLVGIIILLIWLIMLGVATSKFLLLVSSQLLVAAFVFGNTCKTVFEALIFLFVIHPFDVGDRCEIDGVQMIVEEMNILTTVFLRFDNSKIVFPNSILATKPIHNFYRSPDMGDAVEFSIHITTPAEKVALMKQRIVSYVENKKEHWYPAPMIIFKDMVDLNSVKIAVWLTHRMNHQNMGERWARRALLLEEMAKCFRELDIQYRLYPLDINVRALPTSDRLPANWTAPNS